jgi:hypothetical protein
MNTYKIRYPYLGDPVDGGFVELQIESKGLIYAEIASSYGVQCMSKKHHNTIALKCREVANLIREIDKLNNE